MKTMLVLGAFTCLFATLLPGQSKEARHTATLAGTMKTRIFDRILDQRFSVTGTLTLKDTEAVFAGKAKGQEVRIAGVAKNDKIYLVYSSFTGDGVTTVHYIGSKEQNGSYKGTVASLIDTRDYVNAGSFTLAVSAP